ncbi:hypothetical protein VPH35_023603 [Triticum aestivum]
MIVNVRLSRCSSLQPPAASREARCLIIAPGPSVRPRVPGDRCKVTVASTCARGMAQQPQSCTTWWLDEMRRRRCRLPVDLAESCGAEVVVMKGVLSSPAEANSNSNGRRRRRVQSPDAQRRGRERRLSMV